MSFFLLRPTNEDDRSFIRQLITRRWKAEAVVVHGEIFYPAELPGIVADHDHENLGLITYQIKNNQCEIITLDSLKEVQGIGTQLIQAVITKAVQAGCSRIWVVTTNDNLPALGFYQKRGFKIKAIAINAVEKSRILKPSIPLTGYKGIPIRDEIKLEMSLTR
jgi:ribosomal protein S18 acetylase RimI-like enzyme